MINAISHYVENYYGVIQKSPYIEKLYEASYSLGYSQKEMVKGFLSAVGIDVVASGDSYFVAESIFKPIIRFKADLDADNVEDREERRLMNLSEFYSMLPLNI